MARQRRFSFIGYPHLVIAQSNPHAILFNTPEDCTHYIEKWRQLVREGYLEVYAFCLQPTELRLILCPLKIPLANLIQRVHGSYTHQVNQKRNRVGSLFQGRFHSIVFLESELLSVVRSVHLWPVRSGLINRAEAYPYSSHKAYMKGHSMDGLLNIEPVLSHFGISLDLSQYAFERYTELVALEQDDLGIEDIVGGFSKISFAMLQKISQEKEFNQKPVWSLRDLAHAVGFLLNIHVKHLLSPSRRQELVMARRLFATAASIRAGFHHSQIAQYLKRDESQVSRLVYQGLELLGQDEGFRMLFESVKSQDPKRFK